MRAIALSGWILLQLALAAPAWPQEAKGITAYDEAMEIFPNGSARMTTRLVVSGLDADEIDLPLNVAKPENFTAEGDGVKVTASAGKTGDVKVVKLRFARRPTDATRVTVAYDAKEFFDWRKARSPRGVYNLSYTFTNATSRNIGKYTFKMLLPTGFVIDGVASSTPKATGEEVEPPYDFMREKDRVVLTLRSKSVQPGKNAAIAFGFEREERNPKPVMALGFLIAALALYLKRDVLTRADFSREAAG